ncbi:MAG: benzoyl-CoA reductase subunit C [Planctomycetes bacterium]|nr:benzoyl-CoA reductase subunit C [Planctomycetota bacterium]
MSQPAAAALAQLVERAEALAYDVEYSAVRAWKERHPGALAIGFVPVWAPRELIAACGALPVGVVGGGDKVEIIKGDACYQSYVCHLPRSVVELGLNGRLDCLDGMLFPSICDVIRNLSGVWKLLFPNKLSHYLDLPQDFDPEIGGDFFRAELAQLVELLVARGARRPTPASWRQAITEHNENRHLVEELHALRREQPWRVPTSEAYVVARAGCVLPATEHSALLRDYLALVRAVPRAPLDNARVVVAGAFCEQPPLDLLKTLERAGCYIVGDDFLLAPRFVRADVPLEGDPLAAIANTWLAHAQPHASVWTRAGTKGDDLVALARKAGAEGVLFAAPSFCDPALLDQPMQEAACGRAGLPHMHFKYSENSGQFQGIREQAGTFADAIKLWSGA